MTKFWLIPIPGRILIPLAGNCCLTLPKFIELANFLQFKRICFFIANVSVRANLSTLPDWEQMCAYGRMMQSASQVHVTEMRVSYPQVINPESVLRGLDGQRMRECLR
jgi:hypothetical protein